MDVKIDFNVDKIVEKVTNDRFGLYIATEWKRLLDPYVPRDTGLLMEGGQPRPFEIYYGMPYAAYVYYGEGMNFQKKNPYSTDHWDRAAEQAGQKDKLYRTINNALQSGRY